MYRIYWTDCHFRLNPYTICDTLEMAAFCVAYNGRIGPEVPDIPLIVYGLHMQFLKISLNTGEDFGRFWSPGGGFGEAWK